GRVGRSRAAHETDPELGPAPGLAARGGFRSRLQPIAASDPSARDAGNVSDARGIPCPRTPRRAPGRSERGAEWDPAGGTAPTPGVARRLIPVGVSLLIRPRVIANAFSGAAAFAPPRPATS